MNPHQQNKVDISSLSPDEQRLFRLYGKLPNKKDLLKNKLKERKYFDSGDYALSKAGKASDIGVTQIGREHPVPENIPHNTAQHNGNSVSLPVPGNAHHSNVPSSSPVKESSFLHRETSAEELEAEDDQARPSAGLDVKEPSRPEGFTPRGGAGEREMLPLRH